MLHFQKTFFRCSSRRFSTSKCFSGQFRRSTLMGDFLRYGRKKVEILKTMSMLETGIKAKKKTISTTCFYVRTTQYINNVLNNLRF